MAQAILKDTRQTAHLTALSAKHADLDAKIEEEQSKLLPDQMRLQTLKRQKLAVKDSLPS